MVENIEEQHGDNSDVEVHRYQEIKNDLPPVVLNAKAIREIDAAIPIVVREDVRWSADTSQGKNISGRNVDPFLKALENESEIVWIYLSADKYQNGVNSVSFYCRPGHASLRCKFTQQNETEFSIFARFIRGILEEYRQPIPENIKFAYISSELDPSGLDPGEPSTPSSFWRGLNRQRITEDIISRAVSHLIVLIIGGTIGYIVAQF